MLTNILTRPCVVAPNLSDTIAAGCVHLIFTPIQTKS